MSEVLPATLIAGMPRMGEYFVKLIPDLRLPVLLASTETQGSLAYWMYRLDSWLWLLFETSQIAALATLLGACGALLLCFPAAANLAPNRWVYRGFRRTLELFRSVPDLVYALILVWTFGVGPLAGILAIALHTTGALGKLFAEVTENADMRPWDGVRAAGANWVQTVRYAILPQVMPNILSYVLLRFETNVRNVLAREGIDAVDVICPAFSADCLETLEEMAIANRELFIESGGREYRYIPCLNERADHVAMLAAVARAALGIS